MNILGRLTRDAEVRTLSNKKQVVNFSIATNDNYRDKQSERIEQTTFFDCSYWITSKVVELLTKGTLVELMGRVYTRAWIGKDGEAHAGLNLRHNQSGIMCFYSPHYRLFFRSVHLLVLHCLYWWE